MPSVHDDGEGPLFEIIEGERVDREMWVPTQMTAGKIGFALSDHVEREGLEAYVVTWPFIACSAWHPETRRRPAVAMWWASQFPDGIPHDGDAAVAPVVVAEVASPLMSVYQMDRTIGDFISAGVELVWIVNPDQRTIRTEQPDGTAHVYREGDTLCGGPVMPKLKVPVVKLFPKVQR